MDAKSQALRQHGALNPHPEKVGDPLFLGQAFFDPRDLVLVKYEMLRRVRVEGLSVTQAVAAFGFSRPAYYSALALYESQGLVGLIPRRPGPRGAHKLSEVVVEFLHRQRLGGQPPPSATLVQLVREHFGIVVHPRSVRRALARGPKGGR
jgi:transposase